jgi:molybdopterin synthase catalytic subunit
VIRLQTEPIRVEELIDSVRAPGDGAIAVFVGTVRDHNRGRRVLYLEYEAYPEMAESEMQRLVEQAKSRFEASSIAIVHRTGRLEIGEASVAVAVSAKHRGPALEACRSLIDTFKRTVPIWKREVFQDGEVWIEGSGETPVDRQA